MNWYVSKMVKRLREGMNVRHKVKGIDAKLGSLERKKRGYSEQLSKLNLRIKKLKVEERKQIAKLKDAKRELLKAEKILMRTDSRLKENSFKSKAIEEALGEKRNEFSSLEEKVESAKVEHGKIMSETINMKMADSMLRLFLAADAEGLKNWLSNDSAVLLDYIKGSGPSPFTRYYKQLLYEALLGKAYSYYRCSKCNCSFHMQEGKEPRNCPYCSSEKSSLRLIDVFKETSPRSESGIPLLPSPT